MSSKSLAGLILISLVGGASAQQLSVDTEASAGAFPLATGARVADLLIDARDAKVAQLAAGAFAGDVELVTGRRPRLLSDAAACDGPVVIVGTLGRGAVVDRLAREKIIDVSAVNGRWESALIAAVTDPLPGVARGLVIAGSDRRGTAYGVFELSRRIGVSPWNWWADVVPARKAELHVSGRWILDSPKVRYRGIFLNDEDFGLKPWAAKTFEPEIDDIGPKTYARIFELLLRLRANYCWPAMHECTRAFNYYPRNKQVADDYAIVMGSSHCEPLLRSNPDEWPRDGKGEWNWVTNRENILDYWRVRMQENAAFENVWTVGMRAIHDSAMPGGGTLDEKTRRLEDVIRAQRDLIADLVNNDVASAPQILVPYKEVLALYENGLRLPDDVAIVWPDDNQGYIRRLSSPEERLRSGGGGVYYHLSYLGAPCSYLWLDTTPPAQVWQEMTKAYAHDCRRLWVANVGDLKSIEKGMTYFLELAWNPERADLVDQRGWLTEFAAESFGSQAAPEIGAILDGYYRLVHRRRPEHMSREDEFDMFRDGDQAMARMNAFADLVRRAEAVEACLNPELRDAFYELVLYPVRSAASMNEKMLAALRSRVLAALELPAANDWADRAEAAQCRIDEDTIRYNEQVAGGKWRHMMHSAPFAHVEWDPCARSVYAPPDVRRAKAAGPSRLAIMPEGRERPLTADDAGSVYGVMPPLDPIHRGRRFVDLFATGADPVPVRIETDEPWLRLDRRPESVERWERVWLDVDWAKAPQDAAAASLHIESPAETAIVSVRLDRSLASADVATPLAGRIALEAEDGIERSAGNSSPRWRRLDGIGWNGSAALIEPRTAPSLSDLDDLPQRAPALKLRFSIPTSVTARLDFHALPTHPAYEGRRLRCAVAFDGEVPLWLEFPADDEWGPLWSKRVLRARMTESFYVPLAAGAHELKIYGSDPSLILDAVDVVFDAGQ
jgi:hypothetical protein